MTDMTKYLPTSEDTDNRSHAREEKTMENMWDVPNSQYTKI